MSALTSTTSESPSSAPANLKNEAQKLPHDPPGEPAAFAFRQAGAKNAPRVGLRRPPDLRRRPDGDQDRNGLHTPQEPWRVPRHPEQHGRHRCPQLHRRAQPHDPYGAGPDQRLRFTQRHGIRSILNPAPGQALDFAELANADYVIPNETEAEALTGAPVTDLARAKSCARALLDRGLRGVIITLGANGALCGGEHVAAHRVTPVDTTGAGDAFIGAFATFLASGCGEAESIRKANVYAALSTLAIGTQSSFVTREQLDATEVTR